MKVITHWPQSIDNIKSCCKLLSYYFVTSGFEFFVVWHGNEFLIPGMKLWMISFKRLGYIYMISLCFSGPTCYNVPNIIGISKFLFILGRQFKGLEGEKFWSSWYFMKIIWTARVSPILIILETF